MDNERKNEPAKTAQAEPEQTELMQNELMPAKTAQTENPEPNPAAEPPRKPGKGKENIVKRKIKDSVFTDLFRKKEYLLQLYRALHPEDKDATEDSITDVTIENALVNGQYNDLGFLVENRLMILVEAQSTWSVNILIRGLMYIAQSYRQYFEERDESLYSEHAVQLPEPELYVLYTGNRKTRPPYLSMAEEFFGGKQTSIEVRIGMIYDGKEGDIINQYVTFTKVCDEQRRKYGRTREALLETIRICKEQNVLKTYLETREKEVIDMMMFLYDEEKVMHDYIATTSRRAKQEGVEEGTEKTEKKTAKKMLKAGGFTLEQVADFSGLEIEKVKKLKAELNL